jgi:protein-S-isoprenylcysteine O-methyltransferase Ste14
MPLKKIFVSAFLTIGMFIVPLAGALELMLSPQIIFFCVISFASLLAQPDINPKEISSNRKTDGFTAALIMGTIVLAQIAAVIEWAYFPTVQTDAVQSVAIIGYVLLILGFGLRTWAIHVLDKHFTATIPQNLKKELVKKGPYKILRHPSYTGGLVGVTAISIILQNTVTPLLTFICLLLVYLVRISREENHLLKSFGQQFRNYQAQTWRLFPYIW